MAVSLTAVRRLVVGRQGFAGRFRRGDEADVEATIRRLSAVQLDSITAVDRAHRLTLGARIGAYPRDTVAQLLSEGRIFEYWAHEASLLPIELWPHFRTSWRAAATGARTTARCASTPTSSNRCSPASARKGRSARATSKGGGGGGMWNWKPAKMVLEALWDRGQLVIAGRQSFQRRVRPRRARDPEHVLGAPTPSETETLRELALLAVGARGALTEPAIREHWRLKGGRARLQPHLDALVAEGRLREVRPTTAACRSTSCRARSSTARRRRRRSSARSTTSSGTGRCSSGSSASSTSSRSTNGSTSARTATTCSRCSPATASSAAPT